MEAVPMNVWKHANPQLKDLVSYKPGKPIEELARERGLKPEDIIKMASNENPLGPSPKAVAAMTKALGEAHIYPDGFGFKLRDALAQKFGVGIGQIVLGNGSNEIIEFIGHAFLKPGDNIVTAKHAFVVYKLMATVFGAETIEVPDPDFVHDLDAMLGGDHPAHQGTLHRESEQSHRHHGRHGCPATLHGSRAGACRHGHRRGIL